MANLRLVNNKIINKVMSLNELKNNIEDTKKETEKIINLIELNIKKLKFEIQELEILKTDLEKV